MVESQYENVSGESAYKIRALGDDIDVTSIYLVKDDRLYNMEYHTHLFDYPVYFPLFSRMVESIQFTDSTT